MKRLSNVKWTPKLFSGLWFCIGSIIVILYITLNMEFDYKKSIFTFLFGSLASFYFGCSYSKVILDKACFSIKKLVHIILYGWQIAIASVYVTLFLLLLLELSTDRVPKNIYNNDYFSIVTDILLLPVLALFGTLMACIFVPVILISSGLGAILLFMLRNRV